MKFPIYNFLALAIVLINCTVVASTNDAKALFEKYVALQQIYDPTIKNLYSDSAVLRLLVQYPNGSTCTNTIPATVFKRMMESAMLEAKRRGDSDIYSGTAFNEEHGRVRITAKCTSQPNKRSKTISLLIEQSEPGKWQIVEELALSEAKPFLDQKRVLKAAQEWGREIASQKDGRIMFKISGSGPCSVTLLSEAAYQALLQKDVQAARKLGIILSKDLPGPEWVHLQALAAGDYRVLIRNNKVGEQEIRLQCFPFPRP